MSSFADLISDDVWSNVESARSAAGLIANHTSDVVKALSEVLGGAATCSEGFVICFLKVPLACLGSMAAAVQPNSLGNYQKTVYKTFGTSGRPTQYIVEFLHYRSKMSSFKLREKSAKAISYFKVESCVDKRREYSILV